MIAAVDLSAPALRVLHELELAYRQNGGWPVHVRLLADRAEVRSTASVHDYLHELADAGLAERGPGHFDGWRPT